MHLLRICLCGGAVKKILFAGGQRFILISLLHDSIFIFFINLYKTLLPSNYPHDHLHGELNYMKSALLLRL